MAFNEELAQRVRLYLQSIPEITIEEKKMFGGLAFLVNGKMCINISRENLMCRFNPKIEKEVALHKGYKQVVMRGKNLTGYCYISPEGFASRQNFEYYIKICLDFNKEL